MQFEKWHQIGQEGPGELIAGIRKSIGWHRKIDENKGNFKQQLVVWEPKGGKTMSYYSHILPPPSVKPSLNDRARVLFQQTGIKGLLYASHLRGYRPG